MRRILYAASLVAALAGGCGGGTPGGSGREARLLLDSPPRALHIGIYLARSRGYAEAEGTPMRILVPDGTPAEALSTGRADVAVMDIHDLARAREAGGDLVGVMAMVQHRASGASHGPTVDAIDYPEFVLVATRATLDDREPDVRAVIRALQRGYEEVAVDPESAVSLMADESGAGRERLARELDDIDHTFEAGVSDYGLLVRERIERWAERAHEQGLIEKPLDVGRAFDFTLVERSDR